VFKHDGGSIIKRVRAGRGWFNPGNIEGKRTKKRACYAHGVDGGSQVLTEIRQHGLCGGARSSDLTITLKDGGSKTGGREDDRRRKTIGS